MGPRSRRSGSLALAPLISVLLLGVVTLRTEQVRRSKEAAFLIEASCTAWSTLAQVEAGLSLPDQGGDIVRLVRSSHGLPGDLELVQVTVQSDRRTLTYEIVVPTTR